MRKPLTDVLLSWVFVLKDLKFCQEKRLISHCLLPFGLLLVRKVELLPATLCYAPNTTEVPLQEDIFTPPLLWPFWRLRHQNPDSLEPTKRNWRIHKAPKLETQQGQPLKLQWKQWIKDAISTHNCPVRIKIFRKCYSDDRTSGLLLMMSVLCTS